MTSKCRKLNWINCPIDSWIFQVQSIPFWYGWGNPGDVITPKDCVMVTAHSESWITYMQTCVIWKYHWKNFHLEIMLNDFPYSLLSGYTWIIEKTFAALFTRLVEAIFSSYYKKIDFKRHKLLTILNDPLMFDTITHLTLFLIV